MRRIKRAARPAASTYDRYPAASVLEPQVDGTEAAHGKAEASSSSIPYKDRFAKCSTQLNDDEYRLPQRAWGAPAIDFVQISAECGIPASSLQKAPYVEALRQQAKKGLILRPRNVLTPLCLDELLWQGRRRFERR